MTDISNKENSQVVETNYSNSSNRRSDEDWVDTMVSCAQAVNKLFVRNTCRLCQVYTDKQVEYEERLQEDSDSYNPVDRAVLHTILPPLHPEVEFYRQFLFDEDSVVESVCLREDTEISSSHVDDDDEVFRTLSTQRTQ